jgi:hypothetical protein
VPAREADSPLPLFSAPLAVEEELTHRVPVMVSLRMILPGDVACTPPPGWMVQVAAHSLPWPG